MLRRCIITACLPVVVLSAADTVQPTPSKAPVPTGTRNQLVDRVIPAYGMTLQRGPVIDLSAAGLARRAVGFAAEVEARVMAGELHRVGPSFSIPRDSKGVATPGAQPQVIPRKPLPEEVELLELFDATVTLRERLSPPGLSLPIPEQQDLDEAMSSLSRAAELLRQGLGDDTYTDLDARAVAWQQRYHLARAQVRDAKIAELMSTGQSRAKAEQAVDAMTLDVPTPSLEGIPEELRAVVVEEAPAKAETPAPEAQPAAAPTPEPKPEPSDLPPLEAEPEPSDLPPLDAPEPAPAAEPEAMPEPAPEPAEPEAMPEPKPEPAPAPAEPEPAVEPEPEPMPAQPAPEPEPAAEPEPAPAPAEPEPAPAPAPAPALDLDDLPDL